MSGEDKLGMRNLVMKLAQAINHSIAESDEVHRVIEDIRQQGFGVEMSIAACIGLFGLQDESDEVETEIKFELDKMDLDFLKSLRLRIE